MSRRIEDDERIAEWIDGELAPRQLERLQAEFRVDPEFAAAAARHRDAVLAMRAALAADPDEVPAPGLADRVLATAAAAPERSGGAIPAWVWSAAAAAVLVGALLLVRGFGGEDPASRVDDTAFAPETATLDGGRDPQPERNARGRGAAGRPAGDAADEGFEGGGDDAFLGGRETSEAASAAERGEGAAAKGEGEPAKGASDGIAELREQMLAEGGSSDARPDEALPRRRGAERSRVVTPPGAEADRVRPKLRGGLEGSGDTVAYGDYVYVVEVDPAAYAAIPRAALPVSAPSPGGGGGGASGPKTGGPAGPAGNGPAGPATPGPAGPSTPGPAGPSTAGPAGPGPAGPVVPGLGGGAGGFGRPRPAMRSPIPESADSGLVAGLVLQEIVVDESSSNVLPTIGIPAAARGLDARPAPADEDRRDAAPEAATRGGDAPMAYRHRAGDLGWLVDGDAQQVGSLLRQVRAWATERGGRVEVRRVAVVSDDVRRANVGDAEPDAKARLGRGAESGIPSTAPGGGSGFRALALGDVRRLLADSSEELPSPLGRCWVVIRPRSR